MLTSIVMSIPWMIEYSETCRVIELYERSYIENGIRYVDLQDPFIAGMGAFGQSGWCVDLLARRDVAFKDAIEELQRSLENAPISIQQDIDITEVPDELAAEMRGMKKGWHAALEQLKQQINI